ncbi:MAG: ABATE domain-containing protein [Nocardioides sp.]
MTEFRRGLGSVALELVATVADRPGARRERLVTTADLDAWLVGGGLLERARSGASDLADARELRETIWRLVDSSRSDGRPGPRDRATLNDWASRVPSQPQLRPDWTVRPRSGPDVTAALSTVARDAVDLLGGPDRGRIRRCDRCTLLFVDRSRPGNRRWCSMQVCGNRSKAAEFRGRHRVIT